MAIDITVRAQGLPPQAAWWTAIWYDPPNQWNSGWLTPEGEFTWLNIPDTGWFYATAYDSDFNILQDRNPWGRFTLVSGIYRADFATRKLVGPPVEEVPEVPPEAPPPPEERPAGRVWVPLAVVGGIGAGIAGLAWWGRR